MLTVGERSSSEFEMYQRMGEKWSTDLRVSMPGIVQSFDPATQTATIQPALTERIIDQLGNVSMVNLPLLLDVPVIMPRSGGFALTMPVAAGDECLVVFNDMCIDAWWSLGGVQNQAEKRRHDLSDAVAIMGLCSQPKRLPNYDNTKVCLVNIATGTGIKLDENTVNIIAQASTVTGDLSVTGNLSAQGASFYGVLDARAATAVNGVITNVAGASTVKKYVGMSCIEAHKNVAFTAATTLTVDMVMPAPFYAEDCISVQGQSLLADGNCIIRSFYRLNSTTVRIFVQNLYAGAINHTIRVNIIRIGQETFYG